MNLSWTSLMWVTILFLIYTITSCFGLYLIKAAENWKSPVFFIGFFLYSAGAAIWMAILRFNPLSFAFPIAAGALMIGTLLTGAILLNEKVTIWHISGSFLILVGIVLILFNR